MKIGISGHRLPRMGNKVNDINFWIEEQLINLKACYKDIELLTGMAMGVDQNAAIIAAKIGVPFKCYFPYKHKLSDTEQAIVDQANEVLYVFDGYISKQVYLQRDRLLVDDCDILLVVWDGQENGGTYYTYKYAKERGKNIMLYPWKRGAAAGE